MLRWILAAGLWLAASAFGGVTPLQSIAVPSQASGAGFTTLATNLDGVTGFDLSPDGGGSHLWYPNMWFSYGQTGLGYQVPSVATSIYQDQATGLVHLIWTTAFQGVCSKGASGCPSPIISTGNIDVSQARGFGHGYYEEVSRIVPNGSSPNGEWDGFWILGLTTGQTCVANNFAAPFPEYSEMDTMENQPDLGATTVYITYHHASSGVITDCGGGNATVTNQNYVPGSFDWSQYHKFGLLWTSGTFKIYVDDVLRATISSATESENQLHIINSWMAQACSFANHNAGGCLSGGTTQFDKQIQSIRYWSCSTWQTGALVC